MLNNKAFLLTPEESKDPMKCGFAYAMENKSRWQALEIGNPPEELYSYNWATTYIVIKDVVYTIFKDYIIADTKERLFILKNRELANDVPSTTD